MPYLQYTKCVKPADYSGPVDLLAGATSAGILGGVTLNVGLATLGAITAAIAFCNWWLYGRLVCLGGDHCAIGLALEVFPPQLKTGLNREDTDYSVNMLLAPTTLFEGFNQACQDAQGALLKMPDKMSDPDFATMMGNYPGLGFIGEPEPLSGLIDPASQGASYTSRGPWKPKTFYAYNAVIHDGNSNLQYCITPGGGDSGVSPPAWATVGSETTLDGSITWVCLGPDSVLSQVALMNLGLINPVTWAASTPYRVGDLILDSNSNNRTQRVQSCIAAGTSGSAPPNWEDTFGATTSEAGSTVVWSCLGVGGRWSSTFLDSTSHNKTTITYNKGDQIIDGNGNLQTCVTGGNSGSTNPAWKIAAGAPTTDGKCTWQRVGNLGWKSNTQYKTGAQITDFNGNTQTCIVAGKSGSTPPFWGVINGQTTEDTDPTTPTTWICAGQAINATDLGWTPNTQYQIGTQITDFNGNTQTCTVAGKSGSTPPFWVAINGQTTEDTDPTMPAIWTCVGQSINAIGTLEVEFEGGGMHDLLVGLMAALPLAIMATVASAAATVAIMSTALGAAAVAAASDGFWGWLLALLIILVGLIASAIAGALASSPAIAVAGTGYLTGLGDVASPTVDDSTGDDENTGTIYPGQDVLVVMGTWVYDSAHAGWNELHPVLHCQRVAQVKAAELATGNPWVNLPEFSAANVETTLNQQTALRTGWCPLIKLATLPLTLNNQKLPQNGWTIHPDVDGCTPPPAPPPPPK
jgi:hypothetical protein